MEWKNSWFHSWYFVNRHISNVISISYIIIDKLIKFLSFINSYESCKHANIIATIICRSILLGIGFYFNYFIGCTLDTKYYGLFAFSLIIVIETCHICVRRNGIDFKWFSPSYLAFSIQCIAVLWIGSEYTHELHDSECHKNHTHLLYKKMLRHCVIVNNYLER